MGSLGLLGAIWPRAEPLGTGPAAGSGPCCRIRPIPGDPTEKAAASGCVRGGSGWRSGTISVLGERSGVGPGCPGQGGSPHPWGGSNTVGMWPCGTWLSRRGGVGVTAGLGDLRGLLQPSRFCDAAVLLFEPGPALSCPLQSPGAVPELLRVST